MKFRFASDPLSRLYVRDLFHLRPEIDLLTP